MRSFLIILALNLGLVVLDRVLTAPPRESHEIQICDLGHDAEALPPPKPIINTLPYSSAGRWLSVVSLVDAQTIATDASLGNAFDLKVIESGHTLDNPTSLAVGGIYVWLISQPNRGGNTLHYGSVFKWQDNKVPRLSASSGSIDMIECIYNGKSLLCTAGLDLR